ncbi:Cys-tRNA(Pro) deacylase [Acetobacterium tundrae]|uniref:Cys-tRNA(Pro)/Cys-tRNA(Cys) deacylase n=1 Tax=Acetobacterium tundrae TaxID=132932 RepID=A0ABR6WLC7_9FIRM|nr:Cys-tRNA(Pro) deacylase [Acetobacterium tundrae]MBC3797285.1 Cys-tRNA(Pro) deacylase [Acetobacterium tundrae]
MSKQKENKTNAMRILDKLNIQYQSQSYESEAFVDGLKTADHLNLPYELVYKTLVTVGKSQGYFVFVIPIAAELDMKKGAKSVCEKSIAMIHVKDLHDVTGYVRGGCTSIGMKRQFKTIISDTAKGLDKIYISGGKIGLQLKLAPDDLCKAANAVYGDIIMN